MAGVMDAELVIAAAQGGALGSLPCAMISADKAREQVKIIRQRVSAPINMNFFCHRPVEADPDARPDGGSGSSLITGNWAWIPRRRSMPPTARRSMPRCAKLVEELKPEVVSFHFGLPDQALLRRVKAAGAS